MPLQERVGLRGPVLVPSDRVAAGPVLARTLAASGRIDRQHSYREAARLLNTLLPCQPMNHATTCRRTHRIAADLDQMPPRQPAPEPKVTAEAKQEAEIMVLIDGAHIRAAHG